MPIIDSGSVPLISPGNIFNVLNGDTYAIRWIQPTDPVYYTVANRPLSDSVMRQLIIAKAIDNIALRLSHQSNFPFVITPIVVNGALTSGLPLSWIWDCHVSIPQRWEQLKLAKIKRMSGVNSTGSYTGILRFYFTAEESTSGIETYLFYVDYVIDSNLTYQILTINLVTDETPNLDSSEYTSIDGYVIMRTIDPSDDSTLQSLLDNILYPTVGGTTTGELQDSAAGGASNPSDFDANAVSHGTGVLTASAFNAIPAVDAVIDNWLIATNYPFRTSATRLANGSGPITIPQGLFNEFSIVAPTPDIASTSTTDDVFPVWISKIERMDTSANTIKIWLSTYDINHSDSGYQSIDFASLTLTRSHRKDHVVHISSEASLFPDMAGTGYTATDWEQGFGKGYVVLSKKWGTSALSTEVENMFDAIATHSQIYFDFNLESTILSAYAIERSSKNIPTNGQFAALRGSGGDSNPPSASNPYVVKGDSGLGTAVNLTIKFGAKEGISNTGYMATHASPLVHLEVDASKETYDYDSDVSPRLKELFGRNLQFGDRWYDGVRLLLYNGDTWVET